MARQLIKARAVEAKVQRSRRWFIEAIKIGRFPKPVIVGSDGAAHLWDEADIDAWVEEQVANPSQVVRPFSRLATRA